MSDKNSKLTVNGRPVNEYLERLKDESVHAQVREELKSEVFQPRTTIAQIRAGKRASRLMGQLHKKFKPGRFAKNSKVTRLDAFEQILLYGEKTMSYQIMKNILQEAALSNRPLSGREIEEAYIRRQVKPPGYGTIKSIMRKFAEEGLVEPLRKVPKTSDKFEPWPVEGTTAPLYVRWIGDMEGLEPAPEAKSPILPLEAPAIDEDRQEDRQNLLKELHNQPESLENSPQEDRQAPLQADLVPAREPSPSLDPESIRHWMARHGIRKFNLTIEF